MVNNFEPQSAFEGYVKASLENMEKRLDSLPCADSFKRLNKCENDIANMQGKASLLGIVFGFLSGLFAKIFLR